MRRLLPLALLLAACSSTPDSSEDRVLVYQSGDIIPVGFEVLGYIQPESRAYRSGPSAKLSVVKREAARLGADAIIIVRDDAPATDAAINSFLERSRDNGKVFAVARTQYIAIRLLRPRGSLRTV